MMHKAWSSIEEVPYCFARSSVKLQGRTALKIVKFDPNWVFPDCISSLNSPMATKWCTKLEVAWKRCPIVLQGHPSNFTVTRAEKLTIWIQFEITRLVAAIKSLRFALFLGILQDSRTSLNGTFAGMTIFFMISVLGPTVILKTGWDVLLFDHP